MVLFAFNLQFPRLARNKAEWKKTYLGFWPNSRRWLSLSQKPKFRVPIFIFEKILAYFWFNPRLRSAFYQTVKKLHTDRRNRDILFFKKIHLNGLLSPIRASNFFYRREMNFWIVLRISVLPTWEIILKTLNCEISP